MDEGRKYLIISYVTCVTALVAFASYAIARYTWTIRQRKRDQDAIEFITARGTQNMWRIMFSFFASAVGAWCLVSPSQFAVYTGILGLAMYAFASGIPVLIISLFGSTIQTMHPDVTSIADFAGKRFGPVFRSMVVLVCLLNMSIAMLAEYTAMGSLFLDFVGSVNYPIIITVGVLTMIYTAYGGVLISILTDQLQAILTILFIGILSIFVAATFREELPKPLPDTMGVTQSGLSAIFSMPCSLMAATVFSEAMWQKVWASADRRAVVMGGSFAAILISCAVFLFGFAGWLANWGALISWDYDEEGNLITNPNLFLFQVFKTADASTGAGYPARVSSWIGVVALILAVTMNESAVDSLQSGLTGTISSQFFKNQHIFFTRAVVVVINIPIMIIATRGYPILSLFLISNMLTTCCFLPVLTGVFKVTNRYISETAAAFACCTSILTTCMYGGGRWVNSTHTPKGMPLETRAAAFAYGVKYAWVDNMNYDWDYFLTAAGSSVVAMLLWASVSLLVKRRTGWEGPGITGILKGIPGFAFITGSGLQMDLMSVITCGRIKHVPLPHEHMGSDSDRHSSEDGAGVVKVGELYVAVDEEVAKMPGKTAPLTA